MSKRWLVLVSFLAIAVAGYSEEPVAATVCQLKNDPPAYNHKLVQVTGFASQGFEDFTFFDPTCPDWPAIWLEYGGTVKSGTIYCCGVTTDRQRPKQLTVEDIPIPLTDDERFRQFDRRVHRRVRESAVTHVTLIGRFFAGQLTSYGKGPGQRRGYGHMGCCSLFAIQQVTDVDTEDRSDLDYDGYASFPYAKDKSGCGYTRLTPLTPDAEILLAQEQAEAGEHPWAFDDPDRAASEALTPLAKLPVPISLKPYKAAAAQGRKVYTSQPASMHDLYTVILSRPYWLSFYAKDSKRVAWVVLAIYRSSCAQKNSVERIR